MLVTAVVHVGVRLRLLRPSLQNQLLLLAPLGHREFDLRQDNSGFISSFLIFQQTVKKITRWRPNNDPWTTSCTTGNPAGASQSTKRTYKPNSSPRTNPTAFFGTIFRTSPSITWCGSTQRTPASIRWSAFGKLFWRGTRMRPTSSRMPRTFGPFDRFLTCIFSWSPASAAACCGRCCSG